MKEFESKKDTWLLIVIYGSSVLCAFVAIILPVAELSMLMIVTSLFVLLIGCIFPLWLVFSLRYRVDETSLNIVCGPFKWFIPLSDITSIEPTNNPISSPALSLDRLKIMHGKYKCVLVSPSDKTGFIDAIKNSGSGN